MKLMYLLKETRGFTNIRYLNADTSGPTTKKRFRYINILISF